MRFGLADTFIEDEGFKVRKSFAILGVGINCNPTMARRNLVLVLIINCIAYTVDCIAYSVDCIVHSDSSL